MQVISPAAAVSIVYGPMFQNVSNLLFILLNINVRMLMAQNECH